MPHAAPIQIPSKNLLNNPPIHPPNLNHHLNIPLTSQAIQIPVKTHFQNLQPGIFAQNQPRKPFLNKPASPVEI